MIIENFYLPHNKGIQYRWIKSIISCEACDHHEELIYSEIHDSESVSKQLKILACKAHSENKNENIRTN
jgi:hypothetical protein